MRMVITKEKVNMGRQRELDVAKGLAIIFMLLVHVYEVYGGEVEGTGFSKVVEFLGSPPAAPVFMFLLGVGIVYSRKITSKVLLSRGVKLIVLGYVLNFVRDFIPYMILGKSENNLEYITEAWDSLFGIDILPFAGLALIFFAIVKRFEIKDRFLIVLWSIFASLGLLLKGVSFDSEVLNSIFGLIWGTDDYSWFPFLNWIFYPILGYLFAKLLIRCKDKNEFYKNILLITGPLCAALWICTYVNKIDFGAFDLYQTNYYQHDIIGNVIMGIFVLLWISIIYFITRKMPQGLGNRFTRWSRNCNGMYCVHWVILGYSMLILEDSYGMLMQCVLAVILFVLTDFISEFLGRKNIRI